MEQDRGAESGGESGAEPIGFRRRRPRVGGSNGRRRPRRCPSVDRCSVIVFCLFVFFLGWGGVGNLENTHTASCYRHEKKGRSRFSYRGHFDQTLMLMLLLLVFIIAQTSFDTRSDNEGSVDDGDLILWNESRTVPLKLLSN